MTQKNSRTRVKNDGIGENRIQDLYKIYDSSNYNDFINECVNIINDSNASVRTKDRFLRIVRQSHSKDQAVTTVTNFFLAGSGLGV